MSRDGVFFGTDFDLRVRSAHCSLQTVQQQQQQQQTLESRLRLRSRVTKSQIVQSR